MNDESPPISNVLFSYLFVGNTILFLLWLPAFVYQSSTLNSKVFSMFVFILMLIIYSIFSFRAFYHGIDTQFMRGRTRWATVTEGDKEFFKVLSKPIAFAVQILLLIVQVLFLINLY